ncbi:MAG TPA: hypothetical protein PKD90_03605 [Phnomibacter sp.]|nr:hypothetical protein [Phnomibacter sp.]
MQANQDALPEVSPHLLPLLKAEVLCTELLRHKLQFDQLVVQHIGNFRKSFRADVESIETGINERTQRFETTLKVHRDSLYDRLPEGLFHQPQGHSRVGNAEQMKAEHRRYKEEEAQARRFFAPFEQELFRYRLLVEQTEQALALNLNRGVLNEQWYQFWQLPASLPREMVTVMARLMPYAYYIKGNLTLTGQALQAILQKPVTASQIMVASPADADNGFELGKSRLGLNTVPAGAINQHTQAWHFAIAEVTKPERARFPQHQPIGHLLERFREIFVPITTDTIFEPLPAKEDESGTEEEILGFGFIL